VSVERIQRRLAGLGALALALGLLAGLTFAAPALAASPPTWTGAETIDTSTGNYMNAVSCAPGTTVCVAIDRLGDDNNAPSNIMTSSNPAGGASTWSAPAALAGTPTVYSVACPSTSLCLALTETGDFLYSLNPQGGESTWMNEGLVDADNEPSAISCPTTTFCVVGDQAGNVVTSTTPTVASSWQTKNIDPNNPAADPATNYIGDLSCPSASLCVAFDGAGNIFTSTSPTVGSSWSGPTDIDNGNAVYSGSCPSTALCVAVDGTNVLTSTTPAVASSWTSAPLPGGFGTVSCPTTTFCVAVGAGSQSSEFSSSPTGGTGAWSASASFAPNSAGDISCPSTTLCVATDATGPDVWVGTPGTATPQTHTLTVGVSGSGHGTVTGSSIDCPGTCSASFTAGKTVVLSATPGSGSKFSSWSGGCSGTSPTCTVTMNAAEDVTANFALQSTTPTGTKITKAKINAKKHKASFSFTAHGATRYVCELVPPTKKHHKKPKVSFGSCKSPKSYSKLGAGKYTFRVKGVNSAGTATQAADKTFKID
jgi:hypothetical protein